MDECEKCGRCCSNLRIGDEESGLTLFPEEIHMFPEETIRPHLGKGESSPIEIFSYQHTENICVNLKDNLCSVYESRPLMCRSFPVKIGVNGLTFSHGCKAVLNLLKASKTTNRDRSEVKTAIVVAERLYTFHKTFGESEETWKYNLVSEAWEPMKQRY